MAHVAAQSHFVRMFGDGTELITTNFVLAKTHALLLNRIGHIAATRFLDSLFQSSMTLICVTEAAETAARHILHVSVDKDYSYTDATSFANRERLHMKVALTFDHPFAQRGFQVLSYLSPWRPWRENLSSGERAAAPNHTRGAS